MDESNRKMGSMFIASPNEVKKTRNQCTQEGVRAGAKAAAITAVIATVPTIAACRVIPWAKANLNYTGQALIISAASIAAFFITSDKTIHECARANADYDKST
ncbi:early nodulin-93-like [Silene latifolia]|uniref:early nodulin-93-like n=1 Tax=Silene latifolia TaxID=37657 RepID=UPI003D78858F